MSYMVIAQNNSIQAIAQSTAENPCVRELVNSDAKRPISHLENSLKPSNFGNLSSHANVGNTSSLSTQTNVGNTAILSNQANLGNASILSTQANVGNAANLSSPANHSNNVNDALHMKKLQDRMNQLEKAILSLGKKESYIAAMAVDLEHVMMILIKRLNGEGEKAIV